LLSRLSVGSRLPVDVDRIPVAGVRAAGHARLDDVVRRELGYIDDILVVVLVFFLISTDAWIGWWPSMIRRAGTLRRDPVDQRDPAANPEAAR
jgi:hypothetical protein